MAPFYLFLAFSFAYGLSECTQSEPANDEIHFPQSSCPICESAQLLASNGDQPLYGSSEFSTLWLSGHCSNVLRPDSVLRLTQLLAFYLHPLFFGSYRASVTLLQSLSSIQ